MKRRELLLSAFVLLAGCGSDDFHNPAVPWQGSLRHPIPVQGEYSHQEGDTVAYTLAVEYPDGADWRVSSQGCSLSVFALQKKILSVPVEGAISADPDRNRLIGSHLYSYGFDGQQTVVLLDGEEIFRYPSREIIKGMMLTGEGLWTLGQSAAGTGFSLRLDGWEYFSRTSGTIIGEYDSATGPTGALYEDEGSICFSYRSEAGELYVVRDSEPWHIPVEGAWQRIMDARSMGGVEYVCAMEEDGSLVVLADGEPLTVFDTAPARTVYTARFVYGGGDIYLKSTLIYSGEMTCVWNLSHEVVFMSEFLTDLYYYDGNFIYFGTAVDGRDTAYGEKVMLMGDGDRLYSSFCAISLDGKLYAAVTPAGNLFYPYLLSAGRRLAIPVNGYLIAVDALP